MAVLLSLTVLCNVDWLVIFRPDLGFHWVSEQVSHHPPVSAFHVAGTEGDFEFHGTVLPKLKFWGKSVEVEPKGVMTLSLKKYVADVEQALTLDQKLPLV